MTDDKPKTEPSANLDGEIYLIVPEETPFLKMINKPELWEQGESFSFGIPDWAKDD